MTEFQIALLALISIGGIGLAFVIAGVLIKIVNTKKNTECTMLTTGIVVKHSFSGNERFYPVVEFQVNGETYTTKKKFNGIISVRQKGFPIPSNNDAWEDDNGYLYVRTGAIANKRIIAEKLWPLNSPINVFYNPRNPKKNYVERPTSNRVLTLVFTLCGVTLIIVSVLIFFLIQM